MAHLAPAPAPAPDPILDLLHKVIQRRRIRAALRLVAACVLAGLAGAVAMLGFERNGLPFIDPERAAMAGAIAAAIGAAAAVWAKRRSRQQEAFFIDHASRLEEAYGTAVDLVERGTLPTGAVPAQLIASVQHRLGSITPSNLVRIVTPGLILAVMAVGLLSVAALWLAQMPVPDAAAPTLNVKNNAPAAAETISSVAELLAQDAEERGDPLLAAVARSLAERAETSAQGLSDALSREINDLLDQAAATYGDNPPAFLGHSTGMRLEEIEEALAATREAETTAPALRPLDVERNTAGEIQGTPAGGDMYAQRPELADRYAGRSSDEVMASGEVINNGAPITDLGGGSNTDGPQLMEPQQLQSIGSIPVGAALDSGRGVSNAAGLGEQDLQADDAFSQLTAQLGDEVVVSAEPQIGGNRIRIEIVPEAGEGGVSGAASTIGGQTGSGSTQPVARDFVPARAREISARYFERSAQ